jgi:hypothetical protein
MTLEEFFKKNSICGFNETELRDILGLRSEYRVNAVPPNGIMLQKDGRIKPLGCVINHFTHDENGKKLKASKSNSSTGSCYYIQKELGCTRFATPGECRTCFLACLQKLERGEAFRIK